MSSDTPFPQPSTKYHSYPKPESEYQEIIQNPDIFLQKLHDFHLFYGTKFRVPTLDGNQLDLHQLFLEVTSRGGIEKVIRDRRWKEVTGAFNFRSSITSASFVLRKHYLSLLYHFEQVYYFRKEKPSALEVDQASNGLPLQSSIDASAASTHVSVRANLENGSVINGTIDGKFDDGYIVTVNVGSEVFKGVLYHTPMETDVTQNSNTVVEPVHRTRRRHQIAFRDPAHPKPNRSGYTFFFAEQYSRLRPLYHGQEKAISKKIGELWSGLSEAEKQVYQDKGIRDKERYKAEMLEYKSSQNVLL